MIRLLGSSGKTYLHVGKRLASTLPQTTDVVVIGGGVIGTSTAYHLAKRGLQVTLLERHQLTCGTTWHSAAMMNSVTGNVHWGELVDYTRHLVSSGELEEETGVSPGWKRHGGLSVTNNQDRLDEFRMWASLGKYLSWDCKMVDPGEIKYLHPLINTDELLGGIYVASDGSIDPSGLTNAFARGAKLHGAAIFEDCPVSSINLNSTNSIKSVSVGNQKVYTKSVVLAAGAWSRDLAKKIGVEIPTMVNKHSYIISDIIPGISSYPNVRHYDYSLYFKVHNDTIFMGAFEANPTFVDVDPELVYGLYDFEWDVYMPYLEKHMEVMPKLAEVGQKTIICGPETFSPDGMPIFGQDANIDGLFYNLGMSSRGIQLSGGMGREMANLIISGHTSIDMFSFDINRFHPSLLAKAKWQEESIHETEVRTYWVRFPTLQRMSGRNVRKSPLHDKQANQGAFFGCSGGFERPLFFVREKDGQIDKPSELHVPEYDWYGFYGHKRTLSAYESLMTQEYAKWSYSPRISNAIRAEVESCRRNAALFDLSSFGKILVSGKEALESLQWLCTAPMDNKVGFSRYSLMLNEAGGIEADITVTRVGVNDFYIVTGAAFTQYLMASMRRQIKNKFPSVTVTDITDDFAILSLQGPKSRDLLASILASDDDRTRLQSLMYGDSQEIRLMTPEGEVCQARAIRMSYVGELGYELHIKSSSPNLLKIFDTMTSNLDVPLAGFEALNSMSMEKGHKHWHGDLETTDTPQEAGLLFACSSQSDFIGKGQVKGRSPYKRLATFTVAPEVPLNGGEVIYRDGKVVGYLRRGGFGYTINKGLGTGYIDLKERRQHSVRDFVLGGTYQIDVMGTLHSAQVSLQAVFDPRKEKMK